jgi:DNA mismatch repair protein MutS
LIQLEDLKPRFKNYNIAVKEFNDNIIFLRELVRGGTNKSYGIQVAKLAGIPDSVINTAGRVLSGIEKNNWTDISNVQTAPPKGKKQKNKKLKKNEASQMELFANQDSADRYSSVKKMLEKIDISGMTPLEALNFLNDLKQKIL